MGGLDASGNPRPALLEVRELHKHFGHRSRLAARLLRAPYRAVLRGVSLELRASQVCCIRGENGGGKTTLLRACANLLTADAGEILVLGAQLSAASRRWIGFCSGDERSFFLRLTGRQNLRLYGNLFGVPSKLLEQRIQELTESLQLMPWLDRSVSETSSGIRARFGVARALLHSPKLLLLDEPSKSQDDVGRALIAQVLQRSLVAGTGILLVSHEHDALSSMANTTLLLNEGRLTPC